MASSDEQRDALRRAQLQVLELRTEILHAKAAAAAAVTAEAAVEEAHRRAAEGLRERISQLEAAPVSLNVNVSRDQDHIAIANAVGFNEGSNRGSITWRTTGLAHIYRHGIGCHSTQETRVQMGWMTWRAISARPWGTAREARVEATREAEVRFADESRGLRRTCSEHEERIAMLVRGTSAVGEKSEQIARLTAELEVR